MSNPQQNYDKEFRAIMEGLELKEPNRIYGSLAWLKPLTVAVIVLGGMVACVAIAGWAVYVAPVIFMIGVFGLARTLPSARVREETKKLKRRMGKS